MGVDYNVFLLARIREERDRVGTTRQAVMTALERTGGVITSAGLVLAATFSVLMALPLESLFQVGFVVALGLLVDTFLVRALLVPPSLCCWASGIGGPVRPLRTVCSTKGLDSEVASAVASPIGPCRTQNE